jgi:phenol 2-monooxygenase (NADPH)
MRCKGTAVFDFDHETAYNLGLKILACLTWKADPLLLRTYESERRPVAKDLVAFDEQYAQSWSRSFSATDREPNAFKNRHMENMTFTTGVLIHYHPSCLVAEPSIASPLARNLVPGMRLPNFRVLNQADAVPGEIHQILMSDGRFRILVFAGDISLPTPSAHYRRLGEILSSNASCLHRFTPSIDPIDSRIEVITMHAAPRSKVELLDLHEVFQPWSDHGGWDYWKVYADNEDVHGNPAEAYSKCGVSPQSGCLTVIRPDGYVGLVCGMEEVEEIDAFFEGFMSPEVS